jgi:hypothetical protein
MTAPAALKTVKLDRNLYYTGIYYTRDFGVYGNYSIKVTVLEEEEISEDHFVLEMETMHEQRSCCTRIKSVEGPGTDYYGLTSEIRFCQSIAGAQEDGYCNHMSGELSDLNWSEQIPILIEEHWAQVSSDEFAMLRFSLVIKSTENNAPALEPCQDYGGANTNAVPDPFEVEHVVFYPVPEGDQGQKQLRKKRVKVIWKKDM